MKKSKWTAKKILCHPLVSHIARLTRRRGKNETNPLHPPNVAKEICSAFFAACSRLVPASSIPDGRNFSEFAQVEETEKGKECFVVSFGEIPFENCFLLSRNRFVLSMAKRSRLDLDEASVTSLMMKFCALCIILWSQLSSLALQPTLEQVIKKYFSTPPETTARNRDEAMRTKRLSPFT